jgi:hypothetical protein
VLRSESIVHRKWELARSVVGTSAPNPLLEPKPSDHSEATEKSGPEKTEQLRSILERWIGNSARIDSSADSLEGSTIVATVETTQSGFVAAATVHGAPLLLVVADNSVSTGLQDQIDVCATVTQSEAETDSGHVERVLGMIQHWFIAQSASAAAGLEASNALRRREITSRIDALIEDAPPHLRASRLVAAARARVIATTPQCAAIERELDGLSETELPADEWLAAVANLDTGQATPNFTTNEEPLQIHAILLLRAAT